MTAQFAASNSIRTFALCVSVSLLMCGIASAQTGGGGGVNNPLLFRTVVGGVDIDSNGVLNGKTAPLDKNIRERLVKSLNAADKDIQSTTRMRTISLHGLESAINQASNRGEPLPPEIQFMAGLQRIEYIVLSPETNDILISGPAEGWKVNDDGQVVGIKSGTPVLHLEDFLVAMRHVEDARQGQGISVSIDPTQEGIKRLNQFYEAINNNFDPGMRSTIEETVGPQTISLTGVPKDSRFSQVLVAADYKMKRYSMGLEESPIANMPSVLELARRKDAGFRKMAPRFWMECNYEPVATTGDNLVWQIRGQGVRTLTEDSFYNEKGEAIDKAGKVNKFAKQWAGTMTERYDELSKAEPAFRDLRNVMDLAVVSAIMARENLLDKVGLEIPTITGKDSFVSIPTLNVPKTVPTQCSFVHLSRSWLITASGGVQVDSWGVAAKIEQDDAIAKSRQVALNKTADRWWWNSTN